MAELIYSLAGNAVADSSAIAARDVSSPSDTNKTITVFFEEDDQDSETFPFVIAIKNISELKKELLEICGIQQAGKNVIVILSELKEAITNIVKLVNDSSYDLKCKGKERILKLYLSRRN